MEGEKRLKLSRFFQCCRNCLPDINVVLKKISSLQRERGLISGVPFNITFCIGAPRSGTTLLASLLSEGDSCAPMLPECTFITQLIQHYHNIVNYSDKQRFTTYAKSPDHLMDIYGVSIKEIILTAASHFNMLKFDQLILKDPELTLYVDLIPSFFGTNSKIVCIIRDPRDVIESIYKVYAKKNEPVVEADALISQIFNYYWITHQSKLAKAGSIHFVQFEKIVQKNESEFSKLEAYLEYTIGREGFGNVFLEFDRTGPTYSENWGKPINTKIPHNKVSLLSPSFLEKIQSIFSGYNLIYKWW